MQYQTELWQECNNFCDFCYLGKENRFTPDEIKLKSINDLFDKIKDSNFISKYSNISIIGGDFWQGQLRNPIVKDRFFALSKYIIDLLNDGTLFDSWFTAALTLGNQEDLYELLEYYRNTEVGKIRHKDSRGFWICTSYDTIGRFHTNDKLKNWQYHMKKLDEYNVHKNTTIILTEDFMNKVINDEFNIYEFMTEYNTQLFFKHAGSGPYPTKEELEEKLPNFFPRRETAIIFFKKMLLSYPDLYDKIFSIQYRADYLIRNFNNGEETFSARYKDRPTEIDTEAEKIRKDCGHITDYNSYYDSDACILCDKEKVKELLEI